MMDGGVRRLTGLSKREIARRLEREGLRFEPEAEGRHFSVTVHELEATDVRRVLVGAGAVVGMTAGSAEPDDRLRRIVARASVRALYVLGLDSGQAEVWVDGNGRPYVAGVSDEMNPGTAEGVRRTAAAVEAHRELLAREKSEGAGIVLGADPELVWLDPAGRVVPASRFLPPDGSAGCDSVVRRGVRVWPLAELRPEPSAEPADVVASLRRLMRAAAARCGDAPLVWRAGAWPVPGLPLGGHVHISGAVLSGGRLRAIDNAVALPLRLLEPPKAAGRRPRYGALGDFRRQPHGGFEYRTPPSWLVSPRLALGVLALAKIAALHAEELSDARPLDDDRLRDAFYRTGEEGMLREAALAFFGRLRGLEGYRRYSEEAEFVFRAVEAGRHWDETADIRPKWGVRVPG